jgi:uncharacterized protein YecT (DUF1311 family)
MDAGKGVKRIARMIWRTGRLTAVMTSQVVLAGTPAEDFGVRRHPVELVATVNGEPALCSGILTAHKQQFDADSHGLDVGAILAGDAQELRWQPAFGSSAEQPSEPSIGRLDLDLDGTGQQQVVIYRSDPFNWAGNWHYAFVFPSREEFDAAPVATTEQWIQRPKRQVPDPAAGSTVGQIYFPAGLFVSGGNASTGNVWAEHSLFEWHGRYFFFFGTTPFDRYTPHPISIFRLRADGRVAEVCRIEQPASAALYETFQSTAGIASFLRVIRGIGAGGDCGGTMRSGYRHDVAAMAAERRAAIRPWARSDASGAGTTVRYVDNERTQGFLDRWSLQDSWSRREYQTFLEHIEPAAAGVASHLTTQFAVPAQQAREGSVRIIDEVIGARLPVPAVFDGRPGYGENPLVSVLLARDAQRLNTELSNRDSKLISEALSSAIEWPYGLDRLLSIGANPNRANAFGKTPLMVAAHMNRPDAIEVLLRAGADVKSVTGVFSDGCRASPDRTSRTALMYGAENAGPAVLKLLLDAGADPGAKDTKGETADAYLVRNPRFTDEERALGVRGLASRADAFAGPSFKCEQGRSSAEKAICGSQVLRLFDAELARAYGQFRDRGGAAAVAEQRAWLVRRDRRCSVGEETTANEYADCLAEVLRTRTRYLHNRVREGSPAE